MRLSHLVEQTQPSMADVLRISTKDAMERLDNPRIRTKAVLTGDAFFIKFAIKVKKPTSRSWKENIVSVVAHTKMPEHFLILPLLSVPTGLEKIDTSATSRWRSAYAINVLDPDGLDKYEAWLVDYLPRVYDQYVNQGYMTREP